MILYYILFGGWGVFYSFFIFYHNFWNVFMIKIVLGASIWRNTEGEIMAEVLGKIRE